MYQETCHYNFLNFFLSYRGVPSKRKKVCICACCTLKAMCHAAFSDMQGVGIGGAVCTLFVEVAAFRCLRDRKFSNLPSIRCISKNPRPHDKPMHTCTRARPDASQPALRVTQRSARQLRCSAGFAASWLPCQRVVRVRPACRRVANQRVMPRIPFAQHRKPLI